MAQPASQHCGRLLLGGCSLLTRWALRNDAPMGSGLGLLTKQGCQGSLDAASGAQSARLSAWGCLRPGARVLSPTVPSHVNLVGLATSARQPKRVSWLTNLKQLSKFKLSSLVVLTASAGYVVGSGGSVDLQGLAWTSLGTFGAAACANTLNQVYEVANDARMSRTCNRPLPAGRMTRIQALVFAAAAGALGLSILYYKTDELTTALGAANIALYAGVYTPLKQLSIANTWVGAVVGAIPPLMGWSSATGGQLEPGAWVLSAALFFWQMPHFLALAWLCKDDYLRGGFRMISAVDPTGRRTAFAALRNSVYLLPLGLAAYYCGVTSEWFSWEAAGLAAMLCVPAARFVQAPSQQSARKLFRYSLLYLPLLLVGAVVHRQPNQHTFTMTDLQAQLQQVLIGDRVEPGLLPAIRASAERGLLAMLRVLGLTSPAVVLELKCPSKVHSDDGSDVVLADDMALSSHEEPHGDSRTHLSATPPVRRQPLTAYYRGGRIMFAQASGRHAEWPDLVQPGGSWRSGVRAVDPESKPTA